MNSPRSLPDKRMLAWSMLPLLAALGELAVAAKLFAHAWQAAAIVHAAICASLALLAYVSGKKTTSPAPVLVLAFTLFTGLFGAGLCFIAMLAGAYMERSTPEELFAEIMPEFGQQESTRLFELIAFGRDNKGSTGIEPLQDILASGTMLQKQAAIVKITRWFRPKFAPLLRLAAQDADAGVRVQAATAIAKIERDYMLKYLKLEQENKISDQRYKLAALCYNFTLSGMADEESARQLSARAVELYTGLLAERIDQEAVRLRLARLHLERQEPALAKDMLQPLLADGTAPLGTRLLYMEALYHLQEFAALRHEAGIASQQIDPLDTSPQAQELAETITLWAEKPANEEAAHAA